MELIKPGTKINFIGYMLHAVGISGLAILISLIGILVWPGPNWGIDFAGGAEMQVSFNKPIEMGRLRSAVESLGLGEVKVQRWMEIGEDESNKYLIRMEELAVDEAEMESNPEPRAGDTAGAAESGASGKSASMVEAKLAEVFGQGSFEVMKTDFVGPRVGKELRNKGFLSLFVANFLILIYITLRFEFRFAVGAVIALVHDVTITLGAIIWTHREVNLTTIAALLTIIGYSLNDTIVIYDRIRENQRKMRRLTFGEIINVSINETLSRTILTSFTVFIVVLFLFLLGGGVINDFAFAMLVGVVVGSYSTIYVASAFVVWLESLRAKKRTVAPETK
ncbi:MAG TPA: protein translocase subunit SecF [bacterium]|nr:protein translocase subunit SecF [bacterium]